MFSSGVLSDANQGKAEKSCQLGSIASVLQITIINVDSNADCQAQDLKSVDLRKPEAVRSCRAVYGEHLPTTFDALTKTKVQAIHLFRSQEFGRSHSLPQELA